MKSIWSSITEYVGHLSRGFPKQISALRNLSGAAFGASTLGSFYAFCFGHFTFDIRRYVLCAVIALAVIALLALPRRIVVRSSGSTGIALDKELVNPIWLVVLVLFLSITAITLADFSLHSWWPRDPVRVLYDDSAFEGTRYSDCMAELGAYSKDIDEIYLMSDPTKQEDFKKRLNAVLQKTDLLNGELLPQSEIMATQYYDRNALTAGDYLDLIVTKTPHYDWVRIKSVSAEVIDFWPLPPPGSQSAGPGEPTDVFAKIYLIPLVTPKRTPQTFKAMWILPDPKEKRAYPPQLISVNVTGDSYIHLIARVIGVDHGIYNYKLAVTFQTSTGYEFVKFIPENDSYVLAVYAQTTIKCPDWLYDWNTISRPATDERLPPGAVRRNPHEVDSSPTLDEPREVPSKPTEDSGPVRSPEVDKENVVPRL